MTREHVVLLPGEEPREELAELITNPGCWEDDGDRDVIEVPTMSDPDAVIVASSEPEPEPEPEPGPGFAAEPEPEFKEEEAKPARRRKAPVKTEADPA